VVGQFQAGDLRASGLGQVGHHVREATVQGVGAGAAGEDEQREGV
jgi:hypothetical protein